MPCIFDMVWLVKYSSSFVTYLSQLYNKNDQVVLIFLMNLLANNLITTN